MKFLNLKRPFFEAHGNDDSDQVKFPEQIDGLAVVTVGTFYYSYCLIYLKNCSVGVKTH